MNRAMRVVETTDFLDDLGDRVIRKINGDTKMLTKEDIPRFRAEAKSFRAHAKAARSEAAKCKAAGDWVGKLKAECRATEYVRDAQARDKWIKELKEA